MNFQTLTPTRLQLKHPVSLPAPVDADTLERMETHTWTRALKSFAAALDFKLDDLRKKMGELGTLKHLGGDEWELRPKQIPPSCFSEWLSGSEKIPVWRLAEAVIVLEWVTVELWCSAKEAGLPKDHAVHFYLKMANTWWKYFNLNETLRPWSALFRGALRDRLRQNRDRSEYARKIFEHYDTHVSRWDGIPLGESEREVLQGGRRRGSAR
jgi:hypothetical protein